MWGGCDLRNRKGFSGFSLRLGWGGKAWGGNKTCCPPLTPIAGAGAALCTGGGPALRGVCPHPLPILPVSHSQSLGLRTSTAGPAGRSAPRTAARGGGGESAERRARREELSPYALFPIALICCLEKRSKVTSLILDSGWEMFT